VSFECKECGALLEKPGCYNCERNERLECTKALRDLAIQSEYHRPITHDCMAKAILELWALEIKRSEKEWGKL